MRVVLRVGLGMAVLVASTHLAPADASQALPTLALEPVPEPSIWQGLSVGAEVIAVSGHHGGGFGGDVFAGYDREFANGIVLGVEGSTGYAPSLYRNVYRGADFAAADVKVGYDMGRLMPYLTAGVALARPHLVGGLATPGADSLNLVLNGAGETRALTRVGAGVDYALTNHLTVGVAVQAIQGRGPFWP